MKASVVTSDPPPGSDEPPCQVRSLNLVALRCENLDISLRFYTSFGLRFSRFCYAGSDTECADAQVPGSEFALTADTPGAEASGVTLELQPRGDRPATYAVAIGFFVSSVDRAVEAAVAAGGRVLTPPESWPWGRRAAVVDPDGHRVEFAEAPWGRLTGSYPADVEVLDGEADAKPGSVLSSGDS